MKRIIEDNTSREYWRYRIVTVGRFVASLPVGKKTSVSLTRFSIHKETLAVVTKDIFTRLYHTHTLLQKVRRSLRMNNTIRISHNIYRPVYAQSGRGGEKNVGFRFVRIRIAFFCVCFLRFEPGKLLSQPSC